MTNYQVEFLRMLIGYYFLGALALIGGVALICWILYCIFNR